MRRRFTTQGDGLRCPWGKGVGRREGEDDRNDTDHTTRVTGRDESRLIPTRDPCRVIVFSLLFPSSLLLLPSLLFRLSSFFYLPTESTTHPPSSSVLYRY